jgi:N-carbamoyl-L-amino-acid hydrolase
VSRRALFGAPAAWLLGGADVSRLSVDGARLRKHLEALSVFGRPAGGTFADGVSRIGYSPSDVEGRKFVMGLMEQTNSRPRIDAAGNIFCRRAGSDDSLAPVLFGSHIDSVPNGGNFDGDLGVLASVEILRTLDTAGLRTRRPLEVVVWACEEATFNGSALNGSRIAAGKAKPGDLDVVSAGVKKADAIRKIGGDPSRIEEARISAGAFHAYVELHIEQGGILHREGVPIGIVDGIVGIDHFNVAIEGMANHAGTTPMGERQDALVAASRLTLAVREVVTAEEGAQVGTVGHIEVTPNASNVVPGLVRMSIELRDLSSAKLERLGGQVRDRAARIAAESKVKIAIEPAVHDGAALAADSVKSVIEDRARLLGLRTRHLPSGAGHDAQMMATLGPMGMIFVPSIGGISHSPKELTTWEDCARGADVLLQSVLALAG